MLASGTLGPWDKPSQRLPPPRAGIQHVSPQRTGQSWVSAQRGAVPLGPLGCGSHIVQVVAVEGVGARRLAHSTHLC